MFTLNVKTNIDAFQKNISAFAYKQMPFATAQALTSIAGRVVEAEGVNEKKVLDRPRPFTTGAIGVKRARKDDLAATVYMKDITAHYLEPYQFGGQNKLNGKALLKPIGAVSDLDQFGNLPRNWLKKLKGRADIFIGPVQTKNGLIHGVWQRTVEEGTAVSLMTKTGKIRQTRKGLNTSGRLKLLVKFDNAHAVRQSLDWFGVASRTVTKTFNREMGKALAKAIATAR